MVDRFLDSVDLEILSLIAVAEDGRATRYDLAPHGKTLRKPPIRDLAPSSAKFKLDRLARRGYLHSVRETMKHRRRFYRLTTKGFLYLLSKGKMSRDDLQRTLEVYGSILKYPIKKQVELRGKEAVEWRTARKKGVKWVDEKGREIKRAKPPDIMLHDEIHYKPILPLHHHEALRKDLGEELYFQSLTDAALFAYRNIEIAEARDRFLTKTIPKEIQRSRTVREYREKTFVHDFELGFLNYVFHINQPKNLLPFPHPKLHEEIKALLDEETQEIDHQREHVRHLQDIALRHFDPKITQETRELLKHSLERLKPPSWIEEKPAGRAD